MTETNAAPMAGPQLFPRAIGEYDELGYPLLNHECPACSALALIINEWNAVECLTCTWREFGPDSPRADYGKYPDEKRVTPESSEEE